MCGGSEAVERKSERMDTAYSPRLHEEELSATASRIRLSGETPPRGLIFGGYFGDYA